MGIHWRPNGSLDVATAQTDLEEQVSQNDVTSEALARCTNLRLERRGVIETRHGSSRKATKLSPFGVASLIIEHDGARYEFKGQIFRNEAAIATGLTDAQWSAIKYNQFNDTTQQLFALNGTDRKRITGSSVFEWGITPPEAAPTDAVGALTGLTGVYKAKVSYARLVSGVVVSDSNLSPASTGETLANQSLSVTWVASTDTQVTHVRVWRTLAGGTLYYHDQDVAIGATTVDTNTADNALGDEEHIDHTRPPTGEVCAGPFFNGVCLIIDSNKLHACLPQQPEYWPATYYVEVGPRQHPGRAIVYHGGQIFVLTDLEIWQIQGTDATTFLPIPLQTAYGAFNPFGAISVESMGIWHIGEDGIYVYSGGRDKKITQETLDPIFNGQSVGGIPAIENIRDAWLHQYRNVVYFHYDAGNVIAYQLETGRLSYYQYDEALAAPATDEGNDEFLVSDASGYIRQLEDQSVTTDVGNAIEWEVESKEFMLQTRRHFARWVKWDVDASTSGATCTGKIVYDGTVQQNHTITGNRDVKRRHIATGNSRRMSLRLTGTGVIKIYAAELE